VQARLDTKCVFRFQDGHCSWHSFKVATSCSQHSHSALEQRVCTFLNQGSLRLHHLRRGGRSAHGWRRRRRPAAPPDGAPRSRCALRAPRSARQTIPLGSAFWAMANCTADLRSHAACAQESAGSCVDPEGRGQLGETSAPTAQHRHQPSWMRTRGSCPILQQSRTCVCHGVRLTCSSSWPARCMMTAARCTCDRFWLNAVALAQISSKSSTSALQVRYCRRRSRSRMSRKHSGCLM